MVSVGSILKDARAKRKLTVPQMAKKTGVSDRYIGFLEGDRPSHFSEGLFHKICQALKIHGKTKNLLDKQRKALNKRVLTLTRSYKKTAKK